MKEKWTAPRTVIEKFTPNEYVAACWVVSCSWSQANDYEKRNNYWDGGNVKHVSNECGNFSHQYLVDNNGDGTPDAMYEQSSELGRLDCTIYKDLGYSEIIQDLSTIDVGDYIYWTTSSGDRTWHHQGWVKSTAPTNHPNASC